MSSKTEQDEAIILALASGQSHRQAATLANVHHRTVARRMTSTEFRQRVFAKRTELLDATSGKLTSASGRAVDTLLQLLDSKSDAVRLGASRAIIEAALSLKAITELEARMSNIERNAKNEAI